MDEILNVGFGFLKNRITFILYNLEERKNGKTSNW